MARQQIATTLPSLCALIGLLAGCLPSQQGAATIMVVDGCMIKIDGVSAAQAGEITKSWDFDTNCELEVKSRQAKGKVQEEHQ